MQRGFQLLARLEVVRLQHLVDPAVEAFDHAVGLGELRRSEAVFDAQLGAEQVEQVRARGCALAQAEEAIRELLAVIGQDGADAERAGALQVTQKPPRIGRRLCLEDADKHPSRCPVDGDEQTGDDFRQPFEADFLRLRGCNRVHGP